MGSRDRKPNGKHLQRDILSCHLNENTSERFFKRMLIFSRIIIAICFAAFASTVTIAEEPPTLIYVEPFSAPGGFKEGLEVHIQYHPRYALDTIGQDTTRFRVAIVFLKNGADKNSVPKALRSNFAKVEYVLEAFDKDELTYFFDINVPMNGKKVNVAYVNIEKYRKNLNSYTADISDKMLSCVIAGRLFGSIFSKQAHIRTLVTLCRDRP